jgi:HlyD family secretion protein
MNMKTILLLLPAVVFIFFGCNRHDKYAQPETKPLVEAVYASGFVVSENEYQVFSQVDGYVHEKLVNDGDAVKKNDPLFILEADQQDARYRMAKETYELALRNAREDSPVLSELRASVMSAKSKMQFDSINFVRYTNLFQQQATSRGEYDRVKLIYENSRNDYVLANSRYRKYQDQLKLELKNAENQYAIARNESTRYTLRTQVDGTVFKTYKEKGELIRRTELVAIVGSMDAFYLKLNVDELDIHRIKEGQKVVVKIDAYPDRVFNAKISRIYPLVDSRQQSIRVDAVLEEELPGGFSGLALEANIIIRQKDNALVIPKLALLPGDSVIVQGSTGDQKIKIKTGISTYDEVEVVEGLEATSMVKVKF